MNAARDGLVLASVLTGGACAMSGLGLLGGVLVLFALAVLVLAPTSRGR